MCYRCGRKGHVSQECTSESFICYNSKTLTKNPNHTGQTCWKPRVSGPTILRRGFGRGRITAGRSFRTFRGGRSYHGQTHGNRDRQNSNAGSNLYKRVKVTEDGKEKFVFVAVEEDDKVAFFADEQPLATDGQQVEGIISNFGCYNNNNNNSAIFLADSGANEHMCNQRGILSNFVKLESTTNVRSMNKDALSHLAHLEKCAGGKREVRHYVLQVKEVLLFFFFFSYI